MKIVGAMIGELWKDTRKQNHSVLIDDEKFTVLLDSVTPSGDRMNERTQTS